jgi:hypothetical protein
MEFLALAAVNDFNSTAVGVHAPDEAVLAWVFEPSPVTVDAVTLFV